jgi:hypothetical protein
VLNTEVSAITKRIRERLTQHPDATIFLSFPGGGEVTAAIMFAEKREDRRRFPCRRGPASRDRHSAGQLHNRALRGAGARWTRILWLLDQPHHLRPATAPEGPAHHCQCEPCPGSPADAPIPTHPGRDEKTDGPGDHRRLLGVVDGLGPSQDHLKVSVAQGNRAADRATSESCSARHTSCTGVPTVGLASDLAHIRCVMSLHRLGRSGAG